MSAISAIIYSSAGLSSFGCATNQSVPAWTAPSTSVPKAARDAGRKEMLLLRRAAATPTPDRRSRLTNHRRKCNEGGILKTTVDYVVANKIFKIRGLGSIQA